MRCLRCLQENGLLIRGLCCDCAPDFHFVREDDMERFREVSAEYTLQTGKQPMDDWWAFDKWLQRGT